MRNLIARTILVIFTLLFGSAVVSVFSADRLYSMSLAAEKGTRPVEQGIALIDAAIKLDPLDARLYSQKYQLMGLITQDAITQHRNNATTPSAQRPAPSIVCERRLQLATTCVNLSPSVALNHFRYASAMFTVTPHLTRMAKQYLVSELQKASILKPYSNSYKEIYEKYRRVWMGSS